MEPGIPLDTFSTNADGIDLPDSGRQETAIDGEEQASFIETVNQQASGPNGQLAVNFPDPGTSGLGVKSDLPPGLTEDHVNHVPEALNMAVQAWRAARAPIVKEINRFVLEKSGTLWVKIINSSQGDEWVSLNYDKGGEFKFYVPGHFRAEIRNRLGMTQNQPPVNEAGAREVFQGTQKALAAPNADLPQAGTNLSAAIQQLIAGEAHADVYSHSLGYTNLRDLAAGAKFLETARGQLVGTQGKIRQLDILIEHRKDKVLKAQDLSPEVREFQERELARELDAAS